MYKVLSESVDFYRRHDENILANWMLFIVTCYEILTKCGI